MILRGGSDGPNFSPEHIGAVTDKLESVGLSPRVMVDCSHANSGKDPTRQPAVAESLAEQIAASRKGVAGVMIESFLVGGRQNHSPGCELVYGQSITDGCLAWEDTLGVLKLWQKRQKRRAL